MKTERIIVIGSVGAILGLFALYVVFQNIVDTRNGSGDIDRTTISATDARDSLVNQTDPLVTKIPEEILGNKPQPLATDPKRGSTQNPVITLVEFGDFQCGSCADMKPIIESILEEYPNEVMHVWKDFPIPTIHVYAEDAAHAARCAAEQGFFWQYHDLLLVSQSLFSDDAWLTFARELQLNEDAFSSCMSSNQYQKLVTQGYFVGRALNVDTAPSYFINDTFLSGAQSYATLQREIERILTNQ